MKCNFIKFCETQITPFVLSYEETKLYNNYGNYLVGDESSFDEDKGMFIIGVVGCGKTTMFKMAQRFKEKKKTLYFINTESLISQFEEGDSQKMNKYLVNEWCFDDLGTEQKANNYGKGVELFKRIIEERYDKWKYEGLRTHFTTNSDDEDIRDRYGDRAYDRLKEMCNALKYPSQESKRGMSKVKPLLDISEYPHAPDLKSKEEEKAYYDKRNIQIVSLVKMSLKNGINAWERVDPFAASVLFDCYKKIWKIDLFEKNEIDLMNLEENELYKKAYDEVYNKKESQFRQLENNNVQSLKDEIYKSKSKGKEVMELFKKNILVQMMDEKIVESF